MIGATARDSTRSGLPLRALFLRRGFLFSIVILPKSRRAGGKFGAEKEDLRGVIKPQEESGE